MPLLRHLRKTFSPPARRRASATTFFGVHVFVGAYLLAVLGVPLEVPMAVDASTPFPCQQHRCGCASAEQCWRQCCCFSNVQKLAWAKRHGVEAPDYVLAAVEQELADASVASLAAEQERSDHHEHHDHAENRGTLADADCQQGSTRCSQQVGSKPASCGQCSKPNDVLHESSSIVMVQALKCRGLTTYWVALGGGTPPPAMIAWDVDATCRGRVVTVEPRLLVVSDAPPVPPPRA